MSARTRCPVRVGVTIAGSGSALPSRRVTNNDLVSMMDTSDEWIVQRTGIRERRIYDPEVEGTADLAAEAARRAIADAGLSPTDLDLIIVGTMTPDSPTPGVASVVAAKIGAGHVGSLDINGACCGFVFSLNVAHDLVNGGSYKNVLVVGADTITRFCDFSTAGRNVAVLFGDAAGAVVLRASDDTEKGLLAQSMHSDGAGAKNLFVPGRKLDFPPNVEYDPKKIHRIYMDGQAVFKFAVRVLDEVAREVVAKCGLQLADVDWLIPHQANVRILDATAKRLGLPHERLVVTVDRHANTSAASVPLALDVAVRDGRIRSGHRVLLQGVGGGFTWGATLVEF